MTPTTDAASELTPDLIARVFKLSPADRERLGLLLLDSTPDPADGPDETPADVRKAWTEEIVRRVEAYDRGEVRASDWRESLARVRQQLRERRPS